MLVAICLIYFSIVLTCILMFSLYFLGWISLLMRLHESVRLRVYTPGGYGIHLRQPSLLPNVLVFKGHRIKGKPEYFMKKLVI